jgi:Fuc2NAc and GlcNAc transferase
LIKWLTIIALPLILSFGISRLIIHVLGDRLLDVPNKRSSHTIPTPRGGGIAIAAGVIITLFLCSEFGYINTETFWMLAIPGGSICLLGFIDDFICLSIKIRLAIQILLAGLGIYLFEMVGNSSTITTLAMGLLILLLIVWMTNLYNFMDGINGLAGIEAASVCAGMITIFWFAGITTDLTYVMLIFTASICGFLYWNFPAAKLFMGDSGSLFLGLCFGLLACEQLGKRNELVAAWIIMLGVFIVDASYTLTYRLLTKQPVYQAHRSHAYQKIALKYQSHALVSVCAGAINLLWLLPIASLAASGKINGILAIIVAFTPLIIITKVYCAGREIQKY